MTLNLPDDTPGAAVRQGLGAIHLNFADLLSDSPFEHRERDGCQILLFDREAQERCLVGRFLLTAGTNCGHDYNSVCTTAEIVFAIAFLGSTWQADQLALKLKRESETISMEVPYFRTSLELYHMAHVPPVAVSG